MPTIFHTIHFIKESINTGDVGGYVMLIGGCQLILVGIQYIRKMNVKK